MATETPKRSLDNQEFIAWNEDVMPSTSTQSPTKAIKREPIAMETQAEDFDNLSNVDDENDHTGGDEGMRVSFSLLLFIEPCMSQDI